MSSSLGVSLIWYRNDLRIRDHQGLSRAIDSKRQVVAYFNFNPNLFKELNIIKNLGEPLEKWSYQRLDETNRVAKIIKERINI